MALVFFISEVMACLPNVIKRDINSYMREAFINPFAPRGAKTHRDAATCFSSACKQQQASLLFSGDQKTEAFRFQLTLSQTIERTVGGCLTGPAVRHVATTTGLIRPYVLADDPMSLGKGTLPSGQVLAITQTEIYTPGAPYIAPLPAMAAVQIFKVLAAITHSLDYKSPCATEPLTALLNMPVRKSTAPAQRLSCG